MSSGREVVAVAAVAAVAEVAVGFAATVGRARCPVSIVAIPASLAGSRYGVLEIPQTTTKAIPAGLAGRPLLRFGQGGGEAGRFHPCQHSKTEVRALEAYLGLSVSIRTPWARSCSLLNQLMSEDRSRWAPKSPDQIRKQ